MRDPISSEMPIRLAVAFAKTVTVETAVGRGWVARNGDSSLFEALQRILPQVSH